MHKHLLLIFSVIAATILSSCENGTRIADLSQELDPEGWSKDSVSRFDVTIDDVSCTYTALINVRHHTTYPYQNLWLFTSLQRPDGRIEKDSLECILADNSGAWLGNGFGSMQEMSLLYLPKVRFTQKGTYHIEIRHGMRDSLANGSQRHRSGGAPQRLRNIVIRYIIVKPKHFIIKVSKNCADIISRYASLDNEKPGKAEE